MGFNIQYGPISAAMQLANRAGAGQFKQQQFQDDNEFLHTLNTMQQTEDARRATDMQNALGYYGAQSHNNLASAEMQNTAAYRQAELGLHYNQLNNLSGYRGGMLDYRQGSLANHNANTDLAREKLDNSEDKDTRTQDARAGYGPDAQNYANAFNGRPPPAAGVGGVDPDAGLRRNLQALMQAKKGMEVPEIDSVTGIKTGRLLPKPGVGQQYNKILAGVGALTNELNQRAQQRMLQQPPAMAPAGPRNVAPPDAKTRAATTAAASGQGQRGAQPGGQDTLSAEQQAFQQMYQGLPKGATYTDPDGITRVKQ